MRYLLISDVHGNLHALQEVLKHAKKQGYDDILFLGDAIGYGAFPNECVEILREVSSEFLRGNHDSVIIDEALLDYMNPYAKEAIIWSMEQLTDENAEFLANRPVSVNIDKDFLIVHSTPDEPEVWDYIYDVEDAFSELYRLDEWVCAFGHTHIPVVFSFSTESLDVSVLQPGVNLSRDYKYLLNPGSVGQPRDGIPLASYGILDFDKGTFEVYRVEYPVEKAHRAILDAGLPDFLADRLLMGY